MIDRLVLATHHHKGRIIAPVAEAFGWRLDECDVDTDTLGTFSGEVPRHHSPLDSARRKAELAPSDDHAWRAASEGSVSRAWWGGVRDEELVVALAPGASVFVVGRAVGTATRAVALSVSPGTWNDEIDDAVVHALEGGHHLIATRGPQVLGKGLATSDEVRELCLCRDGAEPTLLETDFRAHLCPSRATVIADAARDLLTRLTTRCPDCAQVGVGPVAIIIGRPCAWCGAATDEPRGTTWACPWCRWRDDRIDDERPVDPGRCPRCNP
jgi:hypothetical protein